MYKILIIEDDKTQCENLKSLIASSFTETELTIFTAFNFKDALNLSQIYDIDLFFIDIFLEETSGIDLAKKIRENTKYLLTWMIFVTSDISSIVQAFKETHCYDYIIKPYNPDEIISLCRRLLFKPTDENKNLILKINNSTRIKLPLNSILYIEKSGFDCIIHTVTGTVKSKYTSLKRILESLSNNNFVQSHKSFIVNKDFIKSINIIDGQSWEVEFINSKKMAFIGKKFKNSFKEFNL